MAIFNSYDCLPEGNAYCKPLFTSSTMFLGQTHPLLLAQVLKSTLKKNMWVLSDNRAQKNCMVTVEYQNIIQSHLSNKYPSFWIYTYNFIFNDHPTKIMCLVILCSCFSTETPTFPCVSPVFPTPPLFFNQRAPSTASGALGALGASINAGGKALGSSEKVKRGRLAGGSCERHLGDLIIGVYPLVNQQKAIENGHL